MARILVVDDEADISLMMRIALEAAGHAVLEARTGEDAVAILAGEPVDVMLLDLRLPGIDGWEVLRLVRGDPGLGALKVVIMSAHDSPSTRARTAELGNHAYLTKPFTLAELEDVVGVAIDG